LLSHFPRYAHDPKTKTRRGLWGCAFGSCIIGVARTRNIQGIAVVMHRIAERKRKKGFFCEFFANSFLKNFKINHTNPSRFYFFL
jgi:hypothetical protein